jgi:glycosyltransferase involved in cell wall biosynthesis
MLLSIAMIVKNEERYLEKCLTALLPLQNKLECEIVIVDTGSTDNTVSIAQKFTNKVFIHQWNGSFADMRNISISKCTGEWIFVIDADEILEDGTDIIYFFKSGAYKKFKSAAIGIKTRNEISKEEDFNKYVVANLIRLFEKNDNIYVGRVHEQPIIDSPCYKLKSFLQHYGYVTTDVNLMKYKFERNTKLLFEDLKDNPNHIYTLFQLSNSYSMYGDNKQALNYIRKAYDNIKGKSEIDRYAYVIHQYARMCLANGLQKEAVKACEKAITVKKDFIDFYFYLAQSQAAINKNVEAIQSYKKYLELQSIFDHTNNANDLSMPTYTLSCREEVIYNLAALYAKEGEHAAAIEYIRQIKDKSFVETSLEVLVYCLMRINDLVSVYNLYLNEKDKNFRNTIVQSVEKYMNFLGQDEQEEINRLFSVEDTDYGLVCKIRINTKNNNQDLINVSKDISTFEFDHYNEYKSHLFYYIIKDEFENIYSFFSINNYTLQLYLRDILKNYPESALKMFDFIKSKIFETNINKIYTNIVLEFVLIVSNKFNDVDYVFLFKKYIYDTIKYMKYMYNKDILDINNYRLFTNSEELFCLYIEYSIKNFKDNKLEYIKTLRKALKLCNHHKKGVEFLINEFKEYPHSDEFNKLSADLKNRIQQFISNEELASAKILITEYKKINSHDDDVINMEAIINFYEGNSLEANIKFMDSLLLNEDNFDTLFNIAYLLETDNNYSNSVHFYKMALVKCNDVKMKEIIEDKINEIENIGKVNLI